MTYKNLVDSLENIISAHHMVHTYGYGEISDINVPDNEEAPNYPYVFLNPESISNGYSNFELTINMIAMTQVADSGSQSVLTGQSEMVSIIQDCLSTFISTTDNPLITFQEPFNIQMFQERFSDDVVGATANVTINYGKAIDGCDTPFGPIVPVQSGSCPQVLVTDGDLSQHLVDAGSSYTCIPVPDAPSGIYYNDHTLQVTKPKAAMSRFDGDLFWQFENDIYPIPPQSINRIYTPQMAIDNSYDTALENWHLLSTNNVFGNKYRYTTTIGDKGQFGSGTGFPHFNGDPTNEDQWGEGSVYGVIIDHFTGLMWTCFGQNPVEGDRTETTYTHQGQTYQNPYYTLESFTNEAHGLNGIPQYNRGGWEDWRVPTIHDWASIVPYDMGGYGGYGNCAVSWYWAEDALYDYYVTYGQTGTPPRARDVAWSVSGQPLSAAKYYCVGATSQSTNARTLYKQGVYVRTWRGQTAP